MAEIKLYDVNDFWEQSFIGFGELSAAVIIPQIEAAKDEDILVRINSGGGFIFDGWAIYNALKAHPKKVTVRVEGLAASIASIIAMAGSEVIMAEASMLMIHKPSIDPYFYGSMTADDLIKEAEVLNQIQSVLNSIYAAKTGLDSAIIDDLINAETFLTPSEAVSFGFATSIDSTIKESAVAENIFNHIFKNADVKAKAYANRTIKKLDNMDNPTLQAVNENVQKNNSLMERVLNFLNLNPKPEENEEEAPEEVVEEPIVEEEVTEDVQEEEAEIEPAAQIEQLNAKIAELEAERTAQSEALNSANASLLASNTALENIAKVQSKFKVPGRVQNFEKPKEGQVENSKFKLPTKK